MDLDPYSKLEQVKDSVLEMEQFSTQEKETPGEIMVHADEEQLSWRDNLGFCLGKALVKTLENTTQIYPASLGAENWAYLNQH
eukprot:3982433-Ditylum_brightwellii.AAC.1